MPLDRSNTDNKKITRCTFDLNEDHRKKLCLLAATHGFSMSDMIRAIIDDYYGKSELKNFDFSKENIIG